MIQGKCDRNTRIKGKCNINTRIRRKCNKYENKREKSESGGNTDVIEWNSHLPI